MCVGGWIEVLILQLICSRGAFWDSCILMKTGISGYKDQVRKKDPCDRLFPISIAMLPFTPQKCFLDGSTSCLKTHRPGCVSRPTLGIACDLQAHNLGL